MKNRILLLLKYIHRFNFLEGVKLFIQLSFLKKEVVYLAKHGKVTLRKNSSDIDMFNQVFVSNEYNIDLSYEPQLIIDAGANIGLTSIFFAGKFPLAKIISIEPDVDNFDLLQTNTFKNPNIFPIKKALWVNDDKIFFVRSSSFDSHSVTSNESSSEQVESITVASILKKFNLLSIDILKLDVEGAEKEIFFSNAKEWLPKVKTLIIELHDRFKPGCSMSVFNALNGLDYSMFIKGELLIFNFNQNLTDVQFN